MNRVEYGPEDIAFELERADGFSLKLECVAIFHGNRERLVGIAPRLRDSAAKIVQPARIKPLIEFFEGCKPVRHQIWRKKFGQRRRDGDRPRLTTREVHVCIHCKAYSGQQMSIIQQLVRRKSACFTKSQPCFDAALIRGVSSGEPAIPSVAGAAASLNHAIVIENAMNPSPSHFAHWTVGENRGVFYRNISLIIEPVPDPAAQRFGGKLASVHGEVERMFIVISASADGAQLFDEGFAVPKPRSHKTSPVMSTSTIRK